MMLVLLLRALMAHVLVCDPAIYCMPKLHNGNQHGSNLVHVLSSSMTRA